MKYILTILFCLFSSLINAHYHVATGGSDAADGSIATPWETITKVNTEWAAGTFAPDDSIVFKAGDTFYGTIIIAESGTSGHPIIIGRYGTGADPIVTGFTTLATWADEGDGIYSKAVTADAQTDMVTVDGVQVAMGRYPDAGTNLNFEHHITTASIQDHETLEASADWTGAEIVINKNDYTLSRATVTDHVVDVLSYTDKSDPIDTQTPEDGRYYFIQNDIRCVTSANEWYHSTVDSKLYIYGDPDAKVVKMATKTALIDNSGSYDYITVDNLNLTGAITAAIYSEDNSYAWTIQNCTISFCGKYGIYHADGNPFIANANTVSYCNTSGIYVGYTTAGTITNNTISYIDVLPGQGLRYQSWGIYAGGSLAGAMTVQYNNVQYIGWTGIRLSQTPFNVSYNFVNYACRILDDGAGIYWSGYDGLTRIVSYNIVLNSGVGNPNVAHWARGIYADASAADNTITYNTVAHCYDVGIMNGGGINNTISNNVCFNNGVAGLFIQDYTGFGGGGTLPVGLVVENNKFVAKAASAWCLKIWEQDAQIPGTFTTLDNNYYARPIDDDYVIWPVSDEITLASWKTLTGKDAASAGAPVSVPDTTEIDFYYNYTAAPVVQALPYASIDLAGTKYAANYTIPAYYSAVLLKDPDPVVAPPDMPTVTTAAIDYAGKLVSVTGGGNCTSDGGGTLTAVGVCWSKISGPTTADSKTNDATAEGAFTSAFTGLKGNTTYYVRAYATNEVGTAYGYELSFKTGHFVRQLGKMVMLNGKLITIY